MALERLLAATPPPTPHPQGAGGSGADPIGIQGNAATLAGGNTLAVMSGGTTLDSIVLAGGYAGASFSATTIGGSGAYGNELAPGSPGALLPTGETVDGDPLHVPDSTVALVSGRYGIGTTSDVNITLSAPSTNLANFDFNPNQAVAVPGGEFDLVSILTHEFAHGLGLDGTVNTLNPTTSSSQQQLSAAPRSRSSQAAMPKPPMAHCRGPTRRRRCRSPCCPAIRRIFAVLPMPPAIRSARTS